jgi:hypothetical protein
LCNFLSINTAINSAGSLIGTRRADMNDNTNFDATLFRIERWTPSPSSGATLPFTWRRGDGGSIDGR